MLLIFAAIYQIFDAIYIIYCGALRGAGDTLVPALATAGLCWLCVVGLGYAVATWLPQAGLAGPWTVATIYGVVLGLFMWVRFARGAWRDIRIEREERGFALEVVAEEVVVTGVSGTSLGSGTAWEDDELRVVRGPD
jgi:MATE family multidrug resistance protein